MTPQDHFLVTARVFWQHFRRSGSQQAQSAGRTATSSIAWVATSRGYP